MENKKRAVRFLSGKTIMPREGAGEGSTSSSNHEEFMVDEPPREKLSASRGSRFNLLANELGLENNRMKFTMSRCVKVSLTASKIFPELLYNISKYKSQDCWKMERTGSQYSNMDTDSDLTSYRGEEVLVDAPTGGAVVDDKVFVAVGREVKASKSTLIWSLQNAGMKKLVIFHVHQPAQTISILGGNFSISQLGEWRVGKSETVFKSLLRRNSFLQISVWWMVGHRSRGRFIDDVRVHLGGARCTTSNRREQIKRAIGSREEVYAAYEHGFSHFIRMLPHKGITYVFKEIYHQYSACTWYEEVHD